MATESCATCMKSPEPVGGRRFCQHNPIPYQVPGDDHWCWQYRPNHPFPTGVNEALVDQVLSDERSAARMMLLVMNRLERL